MIQVQDSTGRLRTLPRDSSWWRNTDSGEVYQVISCSNLSDRQEKFQTTVHYRGPNNRQWSKLAIEWFDSFEPLTVVMDNLLESMKGATLDDQAISNVKSLWAYLMEQCGDDGRDYR
jgi:hypothetical protein